jgi:serine/threonine protein kinase
MEEEVGRGGRGVVYRARDTQLKRTIAVKLISRGTVARFQTEAEAVAQLNHSNIAHVYEFNQQDDLHYIVMEYIEGESLSERLAWDGTIPVEEAIRITRSLCDALSHAHGKGIIHRDIKPSNVLLNSEKVPKLVDFGLARIESDQGHTRDGTTLGTIDYMSPEQRRDVAGVDHRSDLWSLGATFYEMLTGEPPHPVDMESIPESVHSTMAKVLKRKPDDRYQTADDFRDALKVALDSPVAHQPRTVPEGELAKGQCRECGAINEAEREFCGACGKKLFQPCLACEVEIGVWEQFCGQCGANVQQLVEKRQQQYRDAFERIESVCRDSRHQEALSVPPDLLEFEHPLFVEQADQLRQALETAREELESLEADRAKVIAAAIEKSGRGEFEAAIKLLETTPKPLREEAWQSAIDRVVADGDHEAANDDGMDSTRLSRDEFDGNNASQKKDVDDNIAINDHPDAPQQANEGDQVKLLEVDLVELIRQLVRRNLTGSPTTTFSLLEKISLSFVYLIALVLVVIFFGFLASIRW